MNLVTLQRFWCNLFESTPPHDQPSETKCSAITTQEYPINHLPKPINNLTKQRRRRRSGRKNDNDDSKKNANTVLGFAFVWDSVDPTVSITMEFGKKDLANVVLPSPCIEGTITRRKDESESRRKEHSIHQQPSKNTPVQVQQQQQQQQEEATTRQRPTERSMEQGRKGRTTND